MATASVPSGTILADHLQKCSHLSNEIKVMQKKQSFSIIKQLMPALKVNIIIVHLKWAGINCIILTWWQIYIKYQSFLLCISSTGHTEQKIASSQISTRLWLGVFNIQTLFKLNHQGNRSTPTTTFYQNAPTFFKNKSL